MLNETAVRKNESLVYKLPPVSSTVKMILAARVEILFSKGILTHAWC